MANSFEIAQTFSNGVLPMKLQYVPSTLGRIRAKTKNNHEISNIDVAIRTWIIALGIHKRISHGLYQRSRRVQDYFIEYIQSIEQISHQHRQDTQIAIDLALPCIEQ